MGKMQNKSYEQRKSIKKEPFADYQAKKELEMRSEMTKQLKKGQNLSNLMSDLVDGPNNTKDKKEKNNKRGSVVSLSIDKTNNDLNSTKASLKRRNTINESMVTNTT